MALTPQDSALLAQLQADPAAGCDALLRQYGGLIQGVLCRALPGRPQDVEECAADVLAAAWRCAPKLSRQGTPLRAWLIVTARNAAIDVLRRSTRRAETQLDEALLPPPGIDPESDWEDAVETLVLAMPQPDREIFQRKYWLLQPSREIGAQLGLTESNVNARLSRGRKQLKAKLEQRFGIEWEADQHETSV